MWNLNNVQRTVKDLYDWQQTHATIGERYLLSDFVSAVDPENDFWKNYRDNHLEYDWYFARRYKNFRFYGQDVEGDNPTEQVWNDFTGEIYDYLALNDKKYSELYKIELLENVPNPTSDYNINDSHTKTLTSEYTSGMREDRTSTIYGQAESSSVDSTKAFNSSDFVEVNKTDNTSEQRTDTGNLSKGEQTDTEEKTYTDVRNASGSKGNPSENLEKYKEVWNGFSFYSMIFDDICKHFLLV